MPRVLLAKLILIAFIALALICAWKPLRHDADAASTGISSLITIQGSGAGTAFGDYVSDASGLNTAHHYYVEVPPGLSRLKVDIFDADIGMGGTAEAGAGRDRDRNGFDSTVSYKLFGPSGTQRNTQFNTGSATGPAGADNAWLTFFDSTGDTVLDNFATTAYTNNNGTLNWSGNWIETNDDNSATTGLISVVSGELRIQDNGDAAPSSIQREANLSGGMMSNPTLSFNLRTTNLEATDKFQVQVSANGGATWSTLETFTGNVAATTRSYDISSFAAVNTRIRFITNTGISGDDAIFIDNVQIKGNGIEAGHWEVRVDMSSAQTTRDDINAFGLRASDGDTTSGGTELNIYADSIYAIGVNPPVSGVATRNYALYPYVSSGCSCAKNDFDYDSSNGNVGSMSFTSRSGGFTKNFAATALSDNNVWRRDSFSGWATDSVSGDYGIWSASVAISSYISAGVINGNYASFYMNNFNAAANPPTANPTTNAFRLYLPTDAGTVPVKPFIDQTLIGPGTPQPVGQTLPYLVWIRVSNPTAHAITFSAPNNILTANVPGSGAVYGGNSQASQGTLISQPAVGGTGDITWNPGTLAAGASAYLTYAVKVNPTAAGQRIAVTGTPASGKGTRAQYVDETGNTTQTRATYLFGPICELGVTQGLLNGVVTILPGLCKVTSSLPNGTVGHSYSQTVSPHPTILVSGSLPPGLSYNQSSGVLSGTPTTEGTYSFSVEGASTGLICAASGSVSVTINAFSPTAADGVISGRTLQDDGQPIEGAVINLSGTQSRKTITDANGAYDFDNVETNGFYSVSPSRVNYLINPPNRSFSQLAHQTEATFTGSWLGDQVNPIDTPEYFVRQQYVDLLAREPEEAGFNYWSDQILACHDDPRCLSSQRTGVASAFFLADEYQQTGSYIYDIYSGALGRRPSLTEYTSDRRQLASASSLIAAKAQLAQSFVLRPEFILKYQSATTAETFVTALLLPLQAQGTDLFPIYSDLVNAYNSGTTLDTGRAEVLQAVADNAQFKLSQMNAAFVLTEYFGYLRRDPDVDGYDFWLNVLNNSPQAYQAMVCSFITSKEYQNRFSTVIAHGNGECGP